MFDDLVRLNAEYGILLNKCTRLLVDEIESRKTVEVVSRNMEVIQVAIGDVHERILNTVDPEVVNYTMLSLKNNLSKVICLFQSKMLGVDLNVDFKTFAKNDLKESDLISFSDTGALTNKHILSKHNSLV